jgi:hypothetical protein
MTADQPFPYDFKGIDAPQATLFREQIRAKIKSIAQYDNKLAEAQRAVLKEADEAIGEYIYQESLKVLKNS